VREDATRGLSLPSHPGKRLGERLAAVTLLPPRKLADGEVRLLLAGARSTEGYAQDLHLCATRTRTLRVASHLAKSRLRLRLGQRNSLSERP
jgi:hypothetical protein